MGKAIVLSRVSTSHQDLSQQTEEVLREAHKDGYSDRNIIIIENVESAIKLSEEERFYPTILIYGSIVFIKYLISVPCVSSCR
jgi:folylpolyglutamate synthase/dihydropteroate synthase